MKSTKQSNHTTSSSSTSTIGDGEDSSTNAVTSSMLSSMTARDLIRAQEKKSNEERKMGVVVSSLLKSGKYSHCGAGGGGGPTSKSSSSSTSMTMTLRTQKRTKCTSSSKLSIPRKDPKKKKPKRVAPDTLMVRCPSSVVLSPSLPSFPTIYKYAYVFQRLQAHISVVDLTIYSVRIRNMIAHVQVFWEILQRDKRQTLMRIGEDVIWVRDVFNVILHPPGCVLHFVTLRHPPHMHMVFSFAARMSLLCLGGMTVIENVSAHTLVSSMRAHRYTHHVSLSLSLSVFPAGTVACAVASSEFMRRLSRGSVSRRRSS